MKLNLKKLLGLATAGALIYQQNKDTIDGAVRQIGRTLGTNKPPKGKR